MIHIDDLILKTISTNFKTAKEVAIELDLPLVRTSVRLRGMRKRNEVICMISNNSKIRGVKPLKYRKR